MERLLWRGITDNDPRNGYKSCIIDKKENIDWVVLAGVADLDVDRVVITGSYECPERA